MRAGIRSANKVGRPPRDSIDVCRTAFWAWTVRNTSGLDFSKIERLLDATCFSPRDGGGYEQPHLWRRYGCGEVSPVGNGRHLEREGTALERSELLFPGTRETYDSVLWQVLRTKMIDDTVGMMFSNQLVPSIQTKILHLADSRGQIWSALCSLSVKSLCELAQAPHIDVLAALLMVLAWEVALDRQIHIVGLMRWWMAYSIDRQGAFQSVRHQLLPTLEAYEPRLGRLSGPHDLALDRSPEENLDEVIRAVYKNALFGNR